MCIIPVALFALIAEAIGETVIRQLTKPKPVKPVTRYRRRRTPYFHVGR